MRLHTIYIKNTYRGGKMRKSRFSVEDMNRILNEPEQLNIPVTEVCKKHGISAHTFYMWKKKAGKKGDMTMRPRSLGSDDARSSTASSTSSLAADQNEVQRLRNYIKHLEGIVASKLSLDL